jgi:hypothetical protein
VRRHDEVDVERQPAHDENPNDHHHHFHHLLQQFSTHIYNRHGSIISDERAFDHGGVEYYANEFGYSEVSGISLILN